MKTDQECIHIPEHPDFERYVATIADLGLPELIAPVRLAKLLDMDRRRIYHLVECGDLAAVRTGKRGLRIFRASVLDWLGRRGSGC